MTIDCSSTIYSLIPIWATSPPRVKSVALNSVLTMRVSSLLIPTRTTTSATTVAHLPLSTLLPSTRSITSILPLVHWFSLTQVSTRKSLSKVMKGESWDWHLDLLKTVLSVLAQMKPSRSGNVFLGKNKPKKSTLIYYSQTSTS